MACIVHIVENVLMFQYVGDGVVFSPPHAYCRWNFFVGFGALHLF